MKLIPDTTTEQGQIEASVMLARLCGWLTTDNAFHNYRPPGSEGGSVNHKRGYPATSIFKPIPNGLGCRTLYDPANMALAWRVRGWFHKLAREEQEREKYNTELWWELCAWEMNLTFKGNHLVEMLPQVAQRAWLDKILQLAIEAGMLEAQP